MAASPTSFWKHDLEAVALYTDTGQATYGDLARSLTQVAAHLGSLGQSRIPRYDRRQLTVLGGRLPGNPARGMGLGATPDDRDALGTIAHHRTHRGERHSSMSDCSKKHSDVLRSVNLVTDRRSPKVAGDVAITLDELRISPDAPAAPPVSSDDLAALMLTSGSTRVRAG